MVLSDKYIPMKTFLRIVTVVLGGYGATWGFVAGLSALLAATGSLSVQDAVVLSAMLGFVFYVGVLLWGFSAQKLWIVTLVLVLFGVGGFLLAEALKAAHSLGG